MKLVELLGEELGRWPEGVTYFVQDSDGEVKAGGGSEPTKPTHDGMWVRCIPLDNYNFYSDLSTDWKTSVVTKDVYTKHKTQMKCKVRKVRKDFDPEKQYNVNVSDCTEEMKKKVQQAFFDVGFQWENCSDYKYLGAAEYTNKRYDGVIVDGLMYSYTTEDFSMTAKEFLDIVYEPENKGHVHADLMAQYVEDAKMSKTPWELWEYLDKDDGWCAFRGSPGWYETTEYRRKTKTHVVNGVEIPDLRVSLEYGTYYYLADPTEREFTYLYLFNGDTQDRLWAERGLCYQPTEEGKQAAILHAKAMLGMLESTQD